MKIITFQLITFSLIIWLLLSCSSSNEEEKTLDGETYSSECTDTRSVEDEYEYEDPVPLIVLKKRGDILACELLNFEYTCGPANTFDVVSEMARSSDGIDTLSVVCIHKKEGVTPRCICHYNIYFVVREVNVETLWFKCQVPNYGYIDFENVVHLNTDSAVVIRPLKLLTEEEQTLGAQ